MTIPCHTATPLFDQAREHFRFLPEGPRLVDIEGRPALVWVNIQTATDAGAGEIHVRFWDDGSFRCYPQLQRPGFLFPTDDPGTLLVGREKELGLLHLPSGKWKVLAVLPDRHPRTIINDGEIVPGGRSIVFGTKDLRFEETIAHLYYYSFDTGAITILADGQTCSNGKVFAREGSDLILYDIDTPRRRIDRYRLEEQAPRLHFDRIAVDLNEAEGFPDGMVDSGERTVIVAYYNPAPVAAGLAQRLSLESGAVLEEWRTLGSPRVTCPLLVPSRAGGVQLILTTATEGMPADLRKRCPNAGNLFIAETSLSDAPGAGVVRLK